MSARAGLLAALLALAPAMVPSVASAQQIVPFGALEASGFGQGVGLLGVGIGTGRAGWGPTASVAAYAVRVRTGPGVYETQTAVAPAVGMRYASATAATAVLGGYVFANNGTTSVGGIGNPTGGEDGPFVTLQHDYWGTGERMAQLIGTYNLDAEYLWSRAKLTQKLGPISPLSAGGEVILQGGGNSGTKSYTTQLGPVLQFQATESLRFDASAGVALRSNNQPSSGYARLEFVFVPRTGP